MLAHCRKQQVLQKDEKAAVVFVLPGIKRGQTRHLVGRWGPMGKVVGIDDDSSQVAFHANEIIAWLEEQLKTKRVPKAVRTRS